MAAGSDWETFSVVCEVFSEGAWSSEGMWEGQSAGGHVGGGIGSWQRLMTPPPQPVSDAVP